MWPSGYGGDGTRHMDISFCLHAAPDNKRAISRSPVQNATAHTLGLLDGGSERHTA